MDAQNHDTPMTSFCLRQRKPPDQGDGAPTGSLMKRFRSLTWKALDDEPDRAQGDGDDSYKGDGTKREGDGGSASVTWESFCNTCRTHGVLR